MLPSTAIKSEPAVLDAARNGDADAFERLVQAERRSLHAHCYRMLGSLHDADDALQETLLRAWRALPRFETRRPLRAWLHRIATNVCLDAIRRRERWLPAIGYRPPLESRGDAPGRLVGEPVWMEPFPDRELGVEERPDGPEGRYEQREAIELAFIAALQHLPPRQRAVLILRDVLGFSAREVAVILETTAASVNSALQRARAAFDRVRPERTQQATLSSLGDARVRGLVERFVKAFEGGDIGAILALLAEDAIFSMPHYGGWCRGRAAIADSWLMPSGPPEALRYVPTRASGQLALGVYRRDSQAGACLPLCLDVLAVKDGEISEVVAFKCVDEFTRFGLPQSLPLERAD